MTRFRRLSRPSRSFRAAVLSALPYLLSTQSRRLAVAVAHDHVCFSTREERFRAHRLAALAGFYGRVLIDGHRLCTLCQVFSDDRRACPECHQRKFIEWCAGADLGCPRCELAEADAAITVDRSTPSRWTETEAGL